MFSRDFNFGFERWVISKEFRILSPPAKFFAWVILLWERASKLDGTAHLWKCK